MMILRRSAEPDVEPVSLTEAKEHLRVDTTADDTYISACIVAARQSAEDFLGRQLITATWVYKLDAFPATRYGADAVLYLPRPPVQSVTSVQYVDTAGATQTLSASLYQTDLSAEPARIAPARNQTWPTTDTDTLAAVTITYVAGYGDAASDVPQAIRQAILLTLGHFYENREDVVVGATANQVPKAATYLLHQYAMKGV